MGRRIVAVVPQVFWALSVIAVVVWALRPGFPVGWDLNVYKLALFSVRAGHDPYLACVAARKDYFDHLWAHPRMGRPFGYIYPPVTLPVLRLLSKCSTVVLGVLYWVAYVVCVAAVVWASLFAVKRHERMVFALLAPAAIFFPGLLQSDPIFSGNIAYIFYGLIFAGAVLGWRKGTWVWFYVAVLAASMIKPTFLSLLALPILTAAGHSVPALATAAVSACGNLVQTVLWPVQFGNYRMSLQSQVVDYVHDFGLHPAGIVADALYEKVPYRLVFAVVYGVCSVVIGVALLPMRAKFLRGEISLREWVPVAMIGVTLLNPRIMQYDLLPITLPMALVAWRFFRRWFRSGPAMAVALGALFLLLDVVGGSAWVQTECLLLVGSLGMGVWTLATERSAAVVERRVPSRMGERVAEGV